MNLKLQKQQKQFCNIFAIILQ
uniref:Uncharacterized protein n=1 Tax=Strigamia maritima TaxID=126957 RepID=T1JN69_STRMM